MFNSNKLIGNKYTLNPLTKDDISEEYIAWLNDPIVNRFLEVRHVHQTIETVTEYINGFYKDQEKYIWGIYSLDGIMIGTISLFEFNRNHNSSAFGLGEDFKTFAICSSSSSLSVDGSIHSPDKTPEL